MFRQLSDYRCHLILYLSNYKKVKENSACLRVSDYLPITKKTKNILKSISGVALQRNLLERENFFEKRVRKGLRISFILFP